MAIYYPEKDYDLPDIDLLTLLFESELSWTKEDTVVEVEAADASNCLTKAQARAYTKRIAYHLRESFGVGAKGPGTDVVVCIASNQILLPPVFWGVVACGGVYSAASSAFTPNELARQVKQGGANLIIASSDCKDVAVKTAEMCGIPSSRVLVLESSAHQRILQPTQGRNLLAGPGQAHESLDWKRITDPTELKESLICLLYSSGTTGVPKGVNISHLNMVSEGLIPQFQVRDYLARRRAREPNYTFTYRTLAHLPAAHIAGVQGYFVNPMIAGGPTFHMPKFDFPKFLEYNKKHQITFFFTVPPIYLLIAKSPLVTDQFKAAEHCITGAAPMGPELMAMAQEKLGCQISQTWGLSETTGSVTVMPWDQHDETGSVSPLMPNCRMRIVDDDEKDVPEGSEGELIVKGPTVTTGYFGNEKATKESFTPDGWFKTGDIGVRKDGKFYVVDRKKVSRTIDDTCRVC
jgi:4-coumarate--CoA ligase